ncbi:MAG: PD-(D/E)XK nuclease-like domain-containing protein [SAR324 cluster bacterium]|nr:PD-(D/E)XK nuclease-like domain-containing protein [SAR324 cluster bacterium]
MDDLFHDSFSGVRLGLDYSEYEAAQALNQTILRRLIAPEWGDANDPHRQQVLGFGSAGHCLLLEPERFLEEYTRNPDGTLSSQESEVPLSVGTWEGLMNVQRTFWVHPEVKRLFVSGHPEVSLFWAHPELQIPCKGRLDWWNPEIGAIVDLKFANGSGRDFARNLVGRRHLDLQLGWYREGVRQLLGIEAQTWVIVIEKTKPYQVYAHQLSVRELASGQKKLAKTTALWQHKPSP